MDTTNLLPKNFNSIHILACLLRNNLFRIESIGSTIRLDNTVFYVEIFFFLNLSLCLKRTVYQLQICTYISKYLVTFNDAVKNTQQFKHLVPVVGNRFADFFNKIILLINIS